MRFEKKVEVLRIEKHEGRETKEFLADVVKLAEGEAFEYILGEVMFCNARIDLSLRPMIPRPETEHWVKQALSEQQDKGALRTLDLFAGSGNVGLAIFKNIPNSTVDFIELDPKLKAQIAISLKKNTIDASRAQVVTGDTWAEVNGVYDLIMAVPPYVPPQMKDEVMQELHAEDPLSFFDKEDGFYFHKQVLIRAKEFLKEGGTLYLEFDITQREKIEELAKEYGFTQRAFLKDPYGHDCAIKLINKLDFS